MGREVRMVRPDWKHPTFRKEEIPLHKGPYSEALADWEENKRQWDLGFVRDWSKDLAWKPKDADDTFEDNVGDRPIPNDYMPEWTPQEATHLQMYETCSEGTPISPVMATPEELARWLADTGASAFGGQTASYEAWLATCKRGWAPSGFCKVGEGITSGVEGTYRHLRG